MRPDRGELYQSQFVSYHRPCRNLNLLTNQSRSSHLIACRYKNFKCTSHNKFFELNLYQKDSVNRHHWRANIARPAADIDLDVSSGEQVSAQRTASDDTK